PSCAHAIELATSASLPSGVIWRFVGGPKTEFISGRLTRIRGASRFEMSTTDTVSFPGGRKTGFPASSQVTFSSLPTSMSCAGAWGGGGGVAADAVGGVSPAVEWEEFAAPLAPSGGAAVLYSNKFALDRARAVAFMRGYVNSSRHYFDAVLRKRSGPEFDEVVAITAKHTGARPDLIRRGFPYPDRAGRLMPGDLAPQTAWWY